jgi:NhaC family Na+:H+ antiporter
LVDYLRYGFGGIMDAIGALSRISNALLKFGLFATVGSCLALNITASDQYLAIVVPVKCLQKRMKIKVLLLKI